jgi:phage protein D
MAKSPLNDRTDIVFYSVEVNGRRIDDKYHLLSCEVEKEAYKISRATLTFIIPFKASEAKAFEISERGRLTPGNAINIKLGYHDRNSSVFEGIIVHQGIEIPIERSPVLTVQCSDEAVRLTLGRNSKCFQEKKDSDIFKEVIENRRLIASVDPTDLRHKQLIQYQAIDWDFIITRAQANGLLVYYEQGMLHVKKPVVSDSCGLELTFGDDILSFKGDLESRFQMPEVTVGTWQFDEQAFQEKKSEEPSIPSHGNLNGKKLSALLGLSPYDVQSTASLENEEMQSWANATLLKARQAAMRGEVSFIGSNLPQINKTIELKGLGKRFNGNALITKVKHSLSEGRWETTVGFGLDPKWYHESRNVNTPLASGLLPAIHGLQNGIVTKIHEDPEGEHRIQVNVPVMGANGEGIWARQAMDYATEGKGLFFPAGNWR